MPTAADLIAYAKTWLGSPYGEGSAALQRGPQGHDCIGMWREWVRRVAPELWPTSWGGPDSWTVPNYAAAWTAHGLPTAGPGALVMPGDALTFGANEHIGLADGEGNCISALNPKQGVCTVPIAKITLPLTLILQTQLEQAVATSPPLPGPLTVAVLPDDKDIRLIGAAGALAVPTGHDRRTYVLGKPVTIPGYSVTGEATSPAHEVTQDGKTFYLLDRNFATVTVK
jgi:hypothetical protein